MVLFADLNEQDFGLIHAPIDDLEFHAGQALYAEGQAALGVFTLRKGMVKLVRVTADGRQRIVRVLRPGDVVGLESLATAHYVKEAASLTNVSSCRIPLALMQTLNANSPRIHKRLMETWQRALREADDWLAEVNFGTARQRVCSFILKMRSTVDPTQTTLFGRDDMGAMMDLKLETVSREISALVRQGVIEPLDRQGRSYRVLQPEALTGG